MFRDEGGRVSVPNFDEILWETTEENAVVEATPLMLDKSSARMLYEELKRYYGDVHDSAALRMDYMGERARVDKFINAITEGRLETYASD